jgi:hypothetical protein
MSIQSTKIELIKLILSVENPKIIKKISSILKNETNDFWNSLTDTQKEEISLGMRQIDEGHSISWDDFLKKVS